MNDNKIKLIAVLELLRTEKSLTEIANKYKILPITLEKWKDSFLSNANIFFKEDRYKFHYKKVPSTQHILLNTIETLNKKITEQKFYEIDTGFEQLNEHTGGFSKGDLIVVASRPSIGKSSFVLEIARKAIERDETVLFFSFEMKAQKLMSRLLSAQTSIPLSSLKSGDLSDSEWDKLSSTTDEIADKDLFIDDNAYADIDYIRAKVRTFKNEYPKLSMIILDSLNLINYVKVRENQYEGISEISKALKQLAREVDLPIIVTSQLNRNLENRENKRPKLNDLRDSGTIEDYADLILFLYRDDVYREAMEKEKEFKAKSEGKEYENKFQNRPEEEAELIIGKHRHGTIGTVKLIFEKRFLRFIDDNDFFEIIYVEDDVTDIGNIELPII
ncbi:MAG TPA: replicative DNA helicase [Arcobacter sp.]|nr:replicative DNA helicase [Arcobacter sp.]